MKTNAPARYIVKDIREGQHTGLRTIREPYWVIDTHTSQTHSEWHSKRAATGTANDLNKAGRP